MVASRGESRVPSAGLAGSRSKDVSRFCGKIRFLGVTIPGPRFRGADSTGIGAYSAELRPQWESTSLRRYSETLPFRETKTNSSASSYGNRGQGTQQAQTGSERGLSRARATAWLRN